MSTPLVLLLILVLSLLPLSLSTQFPPKAAAPVQAITPAIVGDSRAELFSSLISDPSLLRQLHMIAILKSRVKCALGKIPRVEQVVYAQCASAAKNSIALAKCIMALLKKEKEVQKSLRSVKEKAEEGLVLSLSSIGDALARLLPWIFGPLQQSDDSHQSTTTSPTQLFPSTNPIEPRHRVNFASAQSQQTDVSFNREQKSTPKTLPLIQKYPKKKARRPNKQSSFKRKRRRRSIEARSDHNTKRLTSPAGRNLEKLRQIRSFCTEIYRLDATFKAIESHRGRIASFFKELNDTRLSTESKRPISAKTPDARQKRQQDTRTKREGKNVLRVLSPKLFSLFPDRPSSSSPESNGQEDNAILSPSVLGFQDDESEEDEETEAHGKAHPNGPKLHRKQRRRCNDTLLRFSRDVSIPNLMKLASTTPEQKRKWLDFLIEVSGVGLVLDGVLKRLEPLSQLFTGEIMPVMRKVERVGNSWHRILDSGMSRHQLDAMRSHGYTFLSPLQRKILYSRGNGVRNATTEETGAVKVGDRTPPTAADLDSFVEEQLERIAAMEDEGATDATSRLRSMLARRRLKRAMRRLKRDVGPTPPFLPVSGPVVGIFAPFAFVPSVNTIQLFTLYLFSPQFGIPSYFNPAIFYLQLFTPWGALANLFSPQFFTFLFPSPIFMEANLFSSQMILAEILSPTIIQGNLLTPNAILATVASPQLIIGDLLTPQILQLKVLSPQHFTAALLSPNIGSPNLLYSNQSYYIDVLSPQIVSPNIKSYVKNGIIILSPDIFSSGGEDPKKDTNILRVGSEDFPPPRPAFTADATSHERHR